MRLGAGILDQVVDIERQTLAKNALGEDVPTWSTYMLKIRAGRADAADSETFAAGEKSATRRTRWLIRDTKKGRAITAKDRLINGLETYEIAGIKQTNKGRRRYLELTTEIRND